MISKWAYNYLTERLSCARVLPSVSATPLLYRLADGAGVRNVVIYEKVSSYLRWIWCPFSGKMTFFEGKSVIVVNCCYKSSSAAVVVVLKALLANRIYSRMTKGKNPANGTLRHLLIYSPLAKYQMDCNLSMEYDFTFLIHFSSTYVYDICRILKGFTEECTGDV